MWIFSAWSKAVAPALGVGSRRQLPPPSTFTSMELRVCN